MNCLPRQLVNLAIVILSMTAIPGCGSDSKSVPRQADSTTVSDAKSQDSLVIELAGADQTTVLDLLKAKHDVDYRGTVVGAFVTRVDQAESGSEYFWMYSVNDSFPPTACDKCVTSDGDRVVWHYRRMGR